MEPFKLIFSTVILGQLTVNALNKQFITISVNDPRGSV